MKEINDIISWWTTSGLKVQEIDTLLKAYSALAGHSFYFAETVANHHKLFVTSEHERKVDYNQERHERIAEGSTIAGSEISATLKTADKRLKEKYHEMNYRDSKLHLEQINKVLDSMQMRISWLKKEWDRKNLQG